MLDRLIMPSSAATRLTCVDGFAQRLQIHSIIDDNEIFQEYFLPSNIHSFLHIDRHLRQHEQAFLSRKNNWNDFLMKKDPEEDQQARKLFTFNRQVEKMNQHLSLSFVSLYFSWLQQLFPRLCLTKLRAHLLIVPWGVGRGRPLNGEVMKKKKKLIWIFSPNSITRLYSSCSIYPYAISMIHM